MNQRTVTRPVFTTLHLRKYVKRKGTASKNLKTISLENVCILCTASALEHSTEQSAGAKSL